MGDYFTLDELSAFPDDREERFVIIAERSKAHFDKAAKEIDGREAYSQEYYRYLGHIIAAARALKIQRMENINLRPQNETSTAEYQSLDDLIQLEITTIKIEADNKRRMNTVILSSSARERIGSLVGALRKEIEKFEISPRRKKRLFNRLEEFEREFEKGRVSLHIAGAFLLTFVGVMADVEGAKAPLLELVSRIESTLGAEKAERDDTATMIAEENAIIRELPSPDARPDPSLPPRRPIAP